MAEPLNGRIPPVHRGPGPGSWDDRQREVVRKLIHVAAAGSAVAVWLLPRPASALLLALAVVVAVVVELARARHRWVRYHFIRRTRRLLRLHERRGVSGATYMAIAFLVAALIFPRPVAVAAILYTGLGDAAAALVGGRWGSRRTRWGKSWEGTAAAFLVDLLVGLALPGIPWAPALLGAAAASLLEFLPLPFDDNLRVAIGGGGTLWLATTLLG